MYIFAFALPLVAFAAAMLCGADVEYWWAYLLVTAAAEGLLYLVFFFATRSKEYLSGYVTSVIHHFAWVERKEVKETVYGANGKTYTVKTKYVNHPDEYFWEFNTGLKAQIDSGLFYQMCQQWGTGTELIRVYHYHCVEGGDGEVHRPGDPPEGHPQHRPDGGAGRERRENALGKQQAAQREQRRACQRQDPFLGAFH